MLKIIFRIMLAISAILLTGCDPKLEPFSPPDKSFTIKMPGVPKSIDMPPEKENHILGGQMFNALSFGEEYMVMYFDLDFSVNGAPEDLILDQFTPIFKQEGNIVSTIEVSVNGNAGRELHIQRTDGKTEYAQYFISGTRLYMLGVIMKKDDKKSVKNADTFLISFKLGSA